MLENWWMPVASFLIGAIPFSVLVSRLVFRSDVRESGSGNPGATNMLRAYGVGAGFLVLILDIAKAFVPAFLFTQLRDNVPGSQGWMHGGNYFGALAVLGHVYSPFLRFRGGKGVACFVGLMLAAWPAGALMGIGLFLLTLTVTRWVSLGSLLMVVFYAVACLLQGGTGFAWGMMAVAGGVVIWRHRENVSRLLSGSESRFVIRRKVAE